MGNSIPKGNGKIAVMTGSAGGIGKEVAKLLLELGWVVFATDISDEALSVLGESERLHKFAADISELEGCEKLFQFVSGHPLVQEKGIQALLNIAGITQSCPASEVSDGYMQLQFRVNIYAPIRLYKLFLPLMIQSPTGGNVVSVSSLSGRVAWPFQALYASTKFALEGFSDVIRVEAKAAKLKIRVSVIEPGGVATPMTASMGEKKIDWAKRNEDSPFAPVFLKSGQTLNKIQPNMDSQLLKPQTVARQVVLQASLRNPVHRKLVLTRAFKVIYVLIRTAPASLGDKVLAKVS